MENKMILYILMRNDLPSMNAGKAMAQASHASAQFAKIMSKEDELDYAEWSSEGDGFGTTIVLEGSLIDIENFMSTSDTGAYEKGNIFDETYPFKAQKEILDLMTKDNMEQYNIIVVDNNVDKFGMVSCTRCEHTCSWVFFSGNEKELEDFKASATANNLVLHR